MRGPDRISKMNAALMLTLAVVLFNETLGWEICSHHEENDDSVVSRIPLCKFGTKCYRMDEFYAECRPSCPEGWLCNYDLAIINDRFGVCGLSYGRCQYPMRCFRKSRYFFGCNTFCQPNWKCYEFFNRTRTTTPAPTPIYCGRTKGFCPAGLECFKKSSSFHKCHTFCPREWECHKEKWPVLPSSMAPFECSLVGDSIVIKVVGDMSANIPSYTLVKECAAQLMKQRNVIVHTPTKTTSTRGSN